MRNRVFSILFLLVVLAGAGLAQRPIPAGATLPPTCAVNDLFVRTGYGLYVCKATNTWVLNLTPQVDATAIANGLVSNTEFQYLDGVTSAIQTQIAAKANSSSLGTAAALNVAASGNAASGEVVKGNDSRLSDARTPTTHSHAESDVTGLVSDLAAKAPLASPALTGSPTAPSLGRAAASGSNQAGSDFTTYAGAGTGTGLTGDYRIQLAATGSSGSTPNGLIDRQIITKRKALTNSTNTDLVAITLPTLTGASGFLDYTAYASNGTDVQIRRGVIGFSAINKAGAYTTETSIADESMSASAGTLTCTFSFNNGSNQTTLRANCVSSLTPTTYYLIYQLRNQSEQAMAIQ